MKVIVGLGNPGDKFKGTRHNVGFDVVDYMSKLYDIPLDKSKFNGHYGIGMIGNEKVLLLKPLTYMNLSGESLKPILDFYEVDNDNFIVIYDDLDLPVGKIRLRMKGSAGGHNGIKSIIHHVGTQEFKRIRIGIDRPPKGWEITNYVLGRFTDEEVNVINDTVKSSSQACEEWLTKPFIEVMNTYNQLST